MRVERETARRNSGSVVISTLLSLLMVAAAVAVVIHLIRERSGVRRVSSVSVLHRDEDGLVVVVPAVELRPDRVVPRDGAEVLAELLTGRGVSA